MESEGMQKDISCKWKGQENGCNNIHTKQNRLYNKVHKERQRRGPIIYTYIIIRGPTQEGDITLINMYSRDFPGGSVVKNLPANAGETGSIPGPGRSHMPRSN